jgi:hypothetical protein
MLLAGEFCITILAARYPANRPQYHLLSLS